MPVIGPLLAPCDGPIPITNGVHGAQRHVFGAFTPEQIFCPLCAADVVLAHTCEMDLITFSTCWDRWEAFRPRSTWFASCQLSPHLHNPSASRQQLMRREQHHFYSLSSPLPSSVYGDTWREGKFENCIAMCAFLCACVYLLQPERLRNGTNTTSTSVKSKSPSSLINGHLFPVKNEFPACLSSIKSFHEGFSVTVKCYLRWYCVLLIAIMAINPNQTHWIATQAFIFELPWQTRAGPVQLHRLTACFKSALQLNRIIFTLLWRGIYSMKDREGRKKQT